MQIDRRKFMTGIGASLTVSPAISAARADAESSPLKVHDPSRKPHVVLMICNDLRHADPHCCGSLLNTPNLDRMTARGTRFSHFNSACGSSFYRGAPRSLLTIFCSASDNFMVRYPERRDRVCLK